MWLKTLLITVVGAATAYFAGYKTYPLRHPVQNKHIEIRSAAIVSHIGQSAYKIIVMGDSIVELAMLGDMCGMSTLNAGIGGSRIADLKKLAQRLPIGEGSQVIIAAGVNDAQRAAPTNLQAFMADYRELIGVIQSKGAKAKISTIAPISETLPLGEPFFDVKRIDEMNRSLQAMSRDLGLEVIGFHELPRTRNGYLADDLTYDGVHLNSNGYKLWKVIAESSVCQ